jgi:hypothetical protein
VNVKELDPYALISQTDKAALAHFAEALDGLDKQYLEATREKK